MKRERETVMRSKIRLAARFRPVLDHLQGGPEELIHSRCFTLLYGRPIAMAGVVHQHVYGAKVPDCFPHRLFHTGPAAQIQTKKALFRIGLLQSIQSSRVLGGHRCAVTPYSDR